MDNDIYRYIQKHADKYEGKHFTQVTISSLQKKKENDFLWQKS